MTAPDCQPVYFGGPDRPLFGWLHPVAADSKPHTGLVLCNPFGSEAISVHRTYRQCAQMAAGAGVPTLRFDYFGTGDSAGTEFDSEQVEGWVRSVCCAADALIAEAGVSEICLLGVRLGALIAGLAAARYSAVSALATVAAIVRGRSYVRELRALSAARGTQADRMHDSQRFTMLEAAGFAASAETLEDLASLDLLQVSLKDVRHALVIDRPDFPGDRALLAHLQNQRINAVQAVCAGYNEMMLDPHDAVVPTETLSEVVSWLSRLCIGSTASTVDVQAPRPQRHFAPSAVMSSVRETAAFLDADRRVFAVVSTAPRQDEGQRSALIFVNSGSVHHVGPNRIYVSLARRLSTVNLAVVRLDIGGLGDSDARESGMEGSPYPTTAVTDIRTAIAYCRETLGCSDINVAGICSGAYHSLKVAARGEQVANIIIINPLTFFWKSGMSLAQPDYLVTAEASRYRRLLWEPSAWLKVLRGRVNLLSAVEVLRHRIGLFMRNGAREISRLLRVPIADDLAEELRKIAGDRTRMIFIFSDGDPGLGMLLEQGGRTVLRLRRDGDLELTVIEGADHTFTTYAARQSLASFLESSLSPLSHHH